MYKEYSRAVRRGILEVVEILAPLMDDPNDYGEQDGGTNNLMPIHIAAKNGYLKVLKIIIPLTKNPLKSDKYGRTPINRAADGGDVETIKYLMSLTDDPMYLNKYGKSPIHYAAKSGQLQAVRFLVNFTDTPLAPDNNGKTPIHSAVDGYTRFYRWKEEEDIRLRDKRSQEARKIAFMDTVKFLVSLTDNPMTPDNDGNTPINLAPNEEIANFLKNLRDVPNTSV